MGKEQLDALRHASQEDEELAAALAAAATVQDWVKVARDAGYVVEVADLPPDESSDRELSDSELEGAAGGYTFPATDWVYCDNPWTNVYCTLKC